MKCKYWKLCKQYEKKDYTCNETGGSYYSDGRGGGCYREQQELESRYKEL